MNEWSPLRQGFRYVVSRFIGDNWGGGGLVFARNNGEILRFWTRWGAMKYANKRNADEAAV